jgi:hypothetical protein
MMEHGSRDWRKLTGVSVADDSGGRLEESIQNGWLSLAKFQVIHSGTY